MEIEYTPLYKEAMIVINNGATTANLGWTAIIHYGTDTYTPQQVVSVNYIRDYVGSFTDEITCTVQLPLGVYSRLIYPNRLDLQITLTKLPLGETTNAVTPNDPIQSERYSALLIDGLRSPTVGQGTEVNDQNTLDLTQIIDVHFQLYDKALEQIRVMLSGGIYRSTNVQSAIMTLLSNQAMSAVVDGARTITGVDMVPADNTDEKGQIVITHGTKLIDVPDFIQARIGVYNSGIGNYIQNKFWYVYPLYDTTHFNTRVKTLTILILPKRKFSNIERTFRVNGNSLTILITGETGFKDDSGSNYVAHGNGVRFADASTLMDSSTSTSGNTTLIKRDANNSEMVSDTAVAGINHAPVSPNRITANPFVAFSQLALKKGGGFKCIWENSDSSLIVPGMAAKVIYSDNDGIETIYGIVHVVTSISHRASGFSNAKFTNQTALTLFMNTQVSPINS